MIRDLEPHWAPRSRELCPACEATPVGCHSLLVLAGRRCCTACEQRAGDHDAGVAP